MLAAKAIVFAALVFVFGEIVAFPSFFIGAAILHSHAPVSIGDPGVLRAVIGAGLYLTVLGLFALAIAAIVRHTAGAITGVIAFILVLAPLTQLLPGRVGKHIHAYMPTEAGHLIGQAHQAKNDLLTPWQGLGVFCLWTAVLLAIATYLLQRRDA
jgi:ABC-type transport system involved in multi-copper enzyme maturation permease subunit